MSIKMNPAIDVCVLPTTAITAVAIQHLLLPADSNSSICSLIQDSCPHIMIRVLIWMAILIFFTFHMLDIGYNKSQNR